MVSLVRSQRRQAISVWVSLSWKSVSLWIFMENSQQPFVKRTGLKPVWCLSAAERLKQEEHVAFLCSLPVLQLFSSSTLSFDLNQWIISALGKNNLCWTKTPSCCFAKSLKEKKKQKSIINLSMYIIYTHPPSFRVKQGRGSPETTAVEIY